MLLIFRALGDPPTQQLLLCQRERLVRRRRGHEIVGVGGENAPDQLALVRFSRDKRVFGERVFTDVEAKLGFAFLLIRPVTEEAVVREHRPDIAVVGDFVRRLRSGGG